MTSVLRTSAPAEAVGVKVEVGADVVKEMVADVVKEEIAEKVDAGISVGAVDARPGRKRVDVIHATLSAVRCRIPWPV
ncbi:MAG: hypothetical protein MUF31_02495 [Akkermansiaceae bacterium]|jgi:hypothetical protein|nr:hypothetical protein [Akkermansiaceae bacterium]